MRVTVPTRIGPCYPRCTPTYGHGGSGSRLHRLVSGLIPGEVVVLNGLLSNLIAYWPGDEVAGNAIDAHTNGLDLTDTNTVTSNPGPVYPLARQYTAANNEYHTRPGGDALLQTGDVDFTVACWVYLDVVGAGDQRFMTKYFAVGGGREYLLRYEGGATQRFSLFIRNAADTAYASVYANTFGLPVVSTWYLIVAWHDAANNFLRIQVNNGAVDSTIHAGGVDTSASAFRIGTDANAAVFVDGRIGPSMFWKSAAGGGGVLTADQRTALYNGGAGLQYSEFTT